MTRRKALFKSETGTAQFLKFIASSCYAPFLNSTGSLDWTESQEREKHRFPRNIRRLQDSVLRPSVAQRLPREIITRQRMWLLESEIRLFAIPNGADIESQLAYATRRGDEFEYLFLNGGLTQLPGLQQ